MFPETERDTRNPSLQFQGKTFSFFVCKNFLNLWGNFLVFSRLCKLLSREEYLSCLSLRRDQFVFSVVQCETALKAEIWIKFLCPRYGNVSFWDVSARRNFNEQESKLLISKIRGNRSQQEFLNTCWNICVSDKNRFN